MKRLIHNLLTVAAFFIPATSRADWFALSSWVHASALNEMAPGNRFYSPPPGAMRTWLMKRPPSTVTMVNGRATYHSKLNGLSRFEFYGDAFQDPIRIIDGAEVSLISLFSGLENDVPIAKGFDKWEWVMGTVRQAKAGNAMLIATGTADIPGKTVMLLHYPTLLADGDRFSALAIPIGNKSYTDTQGAMTTVAAYDYGLLPSKERMETFVTEYQAALERIKAKQAKPTRQ